MGLGFRVLMVLQALATLPANAQTVIDGDTIKLDGIPSPVDAIHAAIIAERKV